MEAYYFFNLRMRFKSRITNAEIKTTDKKSPLLIQNKPHKHKKKGKKSIERTRYLKKKKKKKKSKN